MKIVKRLMVDAHDRRDLDGLDGLTTPDFEWFPAMAVSLRGLMSTVKRTRASRTTSGTQRGLGEDLRDARQSASEFRDLGHSVLVLSRFAGRGRGSGAESRCATGNRLRSSRRQDLAYPRVSRSRRGITGGGPVGVAVRCRCRCEGEVGELTAGGVFCTALPRSQGAVMECPQGSCAFLAHVERDRLFALWKLAATTGMRRGELLGLTWRHLDLERGRLRVEQQLIPAATVRACRSQALDYTMWTPPPSSCAITATAFDATSPARRTTTATSCSATSWGVRFTPSG